MTLRVPSDRFSKNLLTCPRTIPNILNKFIDRGKDRLNQMSQQGMVYKIFCHDYEATYIGQTKRKLQTRVLENHSDINKTLGSPSVTSNHRVTHNHDFEWNNVKILDFVPSYNKKISKMVHIKKQQK